MTARKPKPLAGAYPRWTGDEDDRLRKLCAGRVIKGEAEWSAIAERFTGRSFFAVRQRHLALRMKAAGIKRDRKPRQRKSKSGKRHMPEPPVPSWPITLHPVSLTAFILGDPLPGRSALDKRQANA